MTDATINSNVGVNINPTGLGKAAQEVENRVKGIVKAIEKAGTAANEQLKALSIGMKQLDTLRTTQARIAGGDFTSAQSLGRQARALAEYRAGISKTSDAVGVLRGRVVALDVANGKLLQSGRVPTKNSVLNAQNLEQTVATYGKLSSQVGTLRGRIALLSDDSRKAFAPMLNQLDAVEKKNTKLFGQNNRFNFKPQLQQMDSLVGKLSQQVSIAEKSEKAERLKLETLREQGRQLLANNEFERLSARAAAVRQGQTILRNADLTGTDVSRRASALQRMASTANYATIAERQLNTELSKPSSQQNAERIQTLINRLQILRRELGLATAEQIKNNQVQEKSAGKGGFFAGVKSVGKHLFDNPEGSGAAFGAGAMVGRVGAYAVVAGAIYGVINAFKQGIGFAIEFEDSLAQLRAISGSTSTEMERLSAGILSVSKNSANSVLELTKSATIIAQAGYGGKEIEQLLQNVVNLSAASGASTDESVDILTSALGSFQLAASEATNVTDALVAALNDSKLSVNQVQLGLQYVGATAQQNNITFNELVATLGAMADAGIRSGSTMSTGLRQMLVDFIDPSEKLISNLERVGLTTADIDVKTLGLTEVLTRLRDSGFQAYGALETRAAAAYAVLSNNIPQMQALEQATLRQNAAQEAAAQRTDSVNAKWQQFLNVISGVMAAIGDGLSPVIKRLLELLTPLAAVVLAPIAAFSQLLGFIFSIGDEADTSTASVEQFEQALINAGVSAEEASARASEMAGGLDDVVTALKDTEAEMGDLETQQQSLKSETEKLILRQEDMAGKNGNLSETTAEVTNQVNLLSARFPSLRSEFKKTEGGIAGLIQAMIALDRKTQETLRNLAQTAIAQAQLNVDAAVDRRNTLQGKFTGGRFTAYRSPVGRSDPNAPAARAFENAIRSGNFRTAQEIANNNPFIRKTYAKNLTELNSIVADYDLNQGKVDQYTGQLRTSQFLLSPDGQRISQNSTRDTARATRAASQGSFGGQSAASIKGELQGRLTELEAKYDQYAGNEYAQGVIASAMSSTRAAIAQLTPEAKDDKKTGGGGGGGGGRKKTGGRSAADRAARDFQRNEAEIKKEEVDYKQQLYENSLTALENAPTLEELPDLMDDIDKNLSSWLTAESELAIEEIKKNKPTAEQEARMLEQAGRKAEQLRIESIDKVADTLSKAIKDYITRTTEAIERQYSEAMRFTERNVKIAQGRLTGLNNPLTQNNVPDYYKTVVQRDLDTANDRNNRAQIGANDTRISQLQALADRVRKDKSDIEARLSILGKQLNRTTDENEILVIGRNATVANIQLRQVEEELRKIEDQTNDLIDTNAGLKASYDVMKDVPTTFKDGFRNAVEAVRINAGAASNFGQELINNLDQPLQALSDGFSTFFTDMLTGSASVGQAFGNLAKSVIRAIEQMVAVALAKQFFSLILGLVAPGISAGTVARLTPDATATIAANPGIFWNGGQIKTGGSGTVTAKRMIMGGPVSTGLPTRDSALIHAAKEEYLIRRPAAQSLGKGFLDAINARGANALKGMGQTNLVAPQAPPVNTNVYVIAPEEKPTMGPNDVIATFSSDVLKGGVTKKLIKQVAAGG